MPVKLIYFALAFFVTLPLYSQVSSDSVTLSQLPFVKVIKNDKSVYIGQILKDDGREILLKTKSIGNLYITKSDIKSIQPIEELKATISGNYREAGPFITRYYFTNNALTGKKGDNYSMVHLYGPEVHISVSDRLSVGVMATWIASPIGLALKYVIPTNNEKVNLSLGTIVLNSGYISQAQGWGGLHWGTVTYGSPGQNISLSSGVGYVKLGGNLFANGLDYFKVASVSSVAGIFPVGDKASFIFDSMLTLSERRNYSEIPGGFVDSEGNFVEGPTVYNSGTEFTSFFMPGMRFQNSDTRAFQVALAGVFQYSSNGFYYSSQFSPQKLRSFPVPMCSWFFKF